MSLGSIFLTQLLARQQAGWEAQQPVLVEDLVSEQPDLAARSEAARGSGIRALLSAVHDRADAAL